MILIVVGIMILVKITMPLNKFRSVILGVNVAALVFFGVVFNKLFAISALSQICLLLLIIFSLASESLFRGLYLLVEKIDVQAGILIEKVKNADF